MKILDDILIQLAQIKADVEKPIKSVDPLPKVKDDSLADYVRELFEDGELFEQADFKEKKHLRRHKPGSKNVIGFTKEEWEKACESLAYGENWGNVWSHRDESWMKERVDGEIPRKITVRKDNITAKFHEFTISPNLSNINLIYNEERKRMGAKDWIEEYTQAALTYGRSVNEIVVDYNIHPQGQVRNIVRRRVVRTPGSMSFLASDGCWYVVFSEEVTAKQIEADFPDVDISQLSTSYEYTKKRTGVQSTTQQQYKHTRRYEKLRVYADDPALEEIPFTKEHESELIDEQIALTNGQPVKARPEQHHLEHIQRKIGGLENFLSLVPPAPDEELEAIPTIQAYLENILEHLDMIEKDKIESKGLRKKYPHGRYICWIGGKVVKDIPNPLSVPWRKLVRELQNTRIAGRIDPAGDPERMYTEAFQADMNLSRVEELALKGLPQVYRKIDDKAENRIDEDDDNDPLTTKYYVTVPPTVVNGGDAGRVFFELYKLSKSNIERDTNVNSISRGEQPPSGTPASLVAMLQRENRLLIMGELDRNLREAMEDIIEGNLSVMREIYKEPRQYVLNGKIEDVNVSELLSFIEVDRNGQKERVEVSMFEVTVKPGSNYPDQWETKFALLIDLRGKVQDPEKTTALEEAIFDHLAIEFPEFAVGGKYRIIGQATQIGMEVLKQRQAEQQQAQQLDKRAERIFNSVEDSTARQLLKGVTNG